MPSEEWSPGRGLVRAMVVMAVRAVVLSAVLVGALWLSVPLLNTLPFHYFPLAILLVVLSVPGAAIGATLARRMTDIAGFTSVVLVMMGTAFAATVAYGSMAIVHEAIVPVEGWIRFMTPMALTVFAGLWMLKGMLTED